MSTNPISRTRRNHALEHASVHLLSKKQARLNIQGNSAPWGFYLNIFGDISDKQVYEAVEEAYRRLKAGERELALHPGCGTVRLTTATMAALAAQAIFSMERRRQRKATINLGVLLAALPAAILAVTVALISAQPLGMAIQANITVEPDLGDLRITSIRPISPSPVTRIFQFILGHAGSEAVHAYRVDTVG